MSPNRRIVLNFVATYGRSLYTLVLGLFCGRWTLMALGEVDYGLMGLVGGLTAFISFVNSLMSTAVARFFAFSVGKAQTKGSEGLDECRRWFNVALLIHSVIPVIFLILGYPVGEWAVRSLLTIPADRVSDCIWVWRFVCLSCFLSMVSVPFNAMYTAKQYIAELTVYTFVTATLNVVFLYYAVSHPGSWLVGVSLWTCVLGIVPQIIIALRALWIFPECRIMLHYMTEWDRIKEIAIYAFYRFFGALSIMINGQGIAILVNKFLGPAKNAAMNIAGSVSGHCDGLSGAFLGALSPAITNAYGAGDMGRVKKLSFEACKISTVMTLIFVLPLFIEVQEVFCLWLKNPPEGAANVCVFLMIALVLENMTCGLYIPIFASGIIKGYQITCFVFGILVLPIAWVLMVSGHGLMSVAYALPIGRLFYAAIRLYFTKRICGFSPHKWIFGIFVPIFCASIVSVGMGLALVYFWAKPSLLRVAMTTIAVNLTFIPLTWFFVFDGPERCLVRDKILVRLNFAKQK